MDLKAELEQRPGAFGFFQAIRMLALWDGKGGLPRNLRFRTPPSLAFPRSEILRIGEPDKREAGDRSVREMEVGFMGLTGPSGVLPSTYTELVETRRLHHQDGALHAFLDLFSHRSITLFFQSWLKYHFPRGVELGQQDGFSQHLLDLVGLGLEARQSRLALSGITGTSIHFGGLLGRRPIPSGSVRAVVEGHLHVPVLLEQFILHWVEVSRADQSRLGGAGREGLGGGAFLGARQQDAQSAVRLVLGPLDQKQFRDLLPGGSSAKDLSELVFLMLGPTMRCEVRLILRKEDVPAPRLEPGQGLSLGRNLWLHSIAPKHDLDNALYELPMPAF